MWWFFGINSKRQGCRAAECWSLRRHELEIERRLTMAEKIDSNQNGLPSKQSGQRRGRNEDRGAHRDDPRAIYRNGGGRRSVGMQRWRRGQSHGRRQAGLWFWNMARWSLCIGRDQEDAHTKDKQPGREQRRYRGMERGLELA
jgi:hypothetical protein